MHPVCAGGGGGGRGGGEGRGGEGEGVVMRKGEDVIFF